MSARLSTIYVKPRSAVRIAAPHWQHVIDTCHISTHTARTVVSVCLCGCVICFLWLSQSYCEHPSITHDVYLCEIAVLRQQLLYRLVICRLSVSSGCYVIYLATQDNIFITK